MRGVLLLRDDETISKQSIIFPCDGYYTNIRIFFLSVAASSIFYLGKGIYSTPDLLGGTDDLFPDSIIMKMAEGNQWHTYYRKKRIFGKRGEMLNLRYESVGASNYYAMITFDFVPAPNVLLEQSILTTIADTDTVDHDQDAITTYPTSLKVLAHAKLISIDGYVMAYDADNDALGELCFLRTRSLIGIDEGQSTYTFVQGDLFDPSRNMGESRTAGDLVAYVPYAVQDQNVFINEFHKILDDAPDVYAGDVISLSRSNLLTTNPGTLVVRARIKMITHPYNPHVSKGNWFDATDAFMINLNAPELG